MFRKSGYLLAKIECVYTQDNGPGSPENIHEAMCAGCGAWYKGNSYRCVVDEYYEREETYRLIDEAVWKNDGETAFDYLSFY
jgi:hypothetical protein